MFKKQWHALAVIVLFTLSQGVKAEDSTNTSSTLKSIKQNMMASYVLLTENSNFQAIDGQKGDGSAFRVRNYFSLGYKIGPKWTVEGSERIDANTGANPDGTPKDSFTFKDFYITASNMQLAKSQRYNTSLGIKMRYYVPTSMATTTSKGTLTDHRNGILEVDLFPGWDIPNSKFSLSGRTYIYYFLPAQAPTVREDYFTEFSPSISYQASAKLAPYIEYDNIFHHRTGTGASVSLPQEDDVELGLAWNTTKKLQTVVYVDTYPFVPAPIRFSTSTFGLVAVYNFL